MDKIHDVFSDLKKKYKKQIKGKSVRMRFNSLSSISFFENDFKLNGWSHGFYYGNDETLTVSIDGSLHQASYELLELFASFWFEYASLTGFGSVEFNGDHSSFPSLGYIQINHRWNKRIVLSENKKYEFAENVCKAMEVLKEKDPALDYGLRTNAYKMPDKNTKSFLLEYYKTGARGTINISPKEDAFYFEESELGVEATGNTYDEIEKTLSDWMNLVYKRNRLNTLYDPPKEHFYELLSDVGAYYPTARDTIFNHLLESYDAEEIETICAKQKGAIKDCYKTMVRQKHITMFYLVNSWFVVFKDDVHIFDKENHTKAVHKFESIVLDVSLGKDLKGKLETLKTTV